MNSAAGTCAGCRLRLLELVANLLRDINEGVGDVLASVDVRNARGLDVVHELLTRVDRAVHEFLQLSLLEPAQRGREFGPRRA